MQPARITLLVLLVGASACGGGGATASFAPLGDTANYGVVWDLTFDRDDAPLIATETGPYRWDGVAWNAYPPPPPIDTNEIVVTQDGALVVVSRGQIHRLAAGASTWEPLYDSTPIAARVVEASDGTLYALQDQGPVSSTMRVLYREVGGAAFVDSGVDVTLFCYPLADADANIWCEHPDTLEVQRVERTESQVFPRAFGFTPMLGHVVKTVAIEDDGTHWAMSFNYAANVGEIWSWNPGSGEPARLRVDGTSCSDGDGSQICADGAPAGGYLTSPVFDRGQGFQLWAPQNGESPYLMRASGGSWAVIADMLTPFASGSAAASGVDPAAVSLAFDHQGRLYAYGSHLDPGALMGTSVVLSVSP